ncbi:MAG: cytochrome B [Rhodoferax sp.]|nr:MAG: cytochrome B [Rhodoferax sp.]
MTTDTTKILVWDAPVRVFHWLMVLCFAGAFVTSESERWQLVHITLGYTMAGLIAFRVMWGLVGTRYARFVQFVRGPQAVGRYLASLATARPAHHTGHNPAGALAIVLILLAGAALTASGWANYNDLGGDWVEELHEVLGNGMLLLVGVHIAGVVVSSRLHRENLARAMVTGRKQGAPSEGIARSFAWLAAVLLAVVLAFWWSQWRSAPQPADEARLTPPAASVAVATVS